MWGHDQRRTHLRREGCEGVWALEGCFRNVVIFWVVGGRNGVMPLMFQEKILRAWRPAFVWAGRMAVGDTEASAQRVCSGDDCFRRFNGGGLTSRDEVDDIEAVGFGAVPKLVASTGVLGERIPVAAVQGF